jgi:serine protease Do
MTAVICKSLSPSNRGTRAAPLFDQNGNVVGIVTAKLNAIKVSNAIGDVPQNVNFALKGSVMMNFLESNRVTVANGNSTTALAPADLADQAKITSVFIRCRSLEPPH